MAQVISYILWFLPLTLAFGDITVARQQRFCLELGREWMSMAMFILGGKFYEPY